MTQLKSELSLCMTGSGAMANLLAFTGTLRTQLADNTTGETSRKPVRIMVEATRSLFHVDTMSSSTTIFHPSLVKEDRKKQSSEAPMMTKIAKG